MSSLSLFCWKVWGLYNHRGWFTFSLLPVPNSWQTGHSLWLIFPLAEDQKTFTMNLDKMSEEEKLKISRKYFIIGFFVLPAVWLANAIWFFKEAFIKRQGHPMIRRYVAGSMLGVLVWVAVVVIWTAVYQTQRPNWGAAGDYISLTVPVGKLWSY